jgi:CheY-like chemotaxis protein
LAEQCPVISGDTSRGLLELEQRRLVAIDRFVQALRLGGSASSSGGRSREAQLDAARRADVRRREHDALVGRLEEQLQAAGAPLPRTFGFRAVLAHRNPWFVTKTVAALSEQGVCVVACADNGADAVGISVAEQPDLVLVEDALPMLRGEDVVRRVREFCPETRVAAQVPYGDGIAALLDAGATTVVTRQVPPAEVVQQMLGLVRG